MSDYGLWRAPANYDQALSWFSERRDKSINARKVCGNTVLRAIGGDDRPPLAVRYYSTDIITYYPDGRVELDPYFTDSTNARYDAAGQPTIGYCPERKLRPRLYCEQRWIFRGPASLVYPLGFPAKPIRLDAKGMVTHVQQGNDWTPVAEFTETVCVPSASAHKARKAQLRLVRKLVGPWAVAQSRLAGAMGRWEITAKDLERLAADPTEEGAMEFIKSSWEPKQCSRPASLALEVALARLIPSKCTDDKAMWPRVDVHPSDTDWTMTKAE